MSDVWIGEEDSIYLGHDPLQALDEGWGELLVPADVEEEGEVVDLEQVAVRRLVPAPGQGVQADDGGHPQFTSQTSFSGLSLYRVMICGYICPIDLCNTVLCLS